MFPRQAKAVRPVLPRSYALLNTLYLTSGDLALTFGHHENVKNYTLVETTVSYISKLWKLAIFDVW